MMQIKIIGEKTLICERRKKVEILGNRMAKVEVNRIGIPRAPLLESWEGEKQSEERSKRRLKKVYYLLAREVLFKFYKVRSFDTVRSGLFRLLTCLWRKDVNYQDFNLFLPLYLFISPDIQDYILKIINYFFNTFNHYFEHIKKFVKKRKKK